MSLSLQENVLPIIVAYGSKILIGIVMLLVGVFLIKAVTKFISRSMKGKVEDSLYSFTLSFTRAALYIILFISIAATLGAEMTSFVAILGSAGLAVGLALQGSLSNIAGGVLILLFKPFKVGDFIEGDGNEGIVKEINILYTFLITFDNRRVSIPNGHLANNSIINYSAEKLRRVDLTFGVGYEDDIHKVRGVLQKVISRNGKILQEPTPMIKVAEHAASSINFAVKVWCLTENYWEVYYDMQEQVKLAFDEADINIPYPQMDLHFHGEE